MTRLLRAAVLIACALAAWQALYWYAGSRALTSPLDTIAFTADLVMSARFYPHLIETGRVVLQGSSSELKSNDSVRRSYLGY